MDFSGLWWSDDIRTEFHVQCAKPWEIFGQTASESAEIIGRQKLFGTNQRPNGWTLCESWWCQRCHQHSKTVDWWIDDTSSQCSNQIVAGHRYKHWDSTWWQRLCDAHCISSRLFSYCSTVNRCSCRHRAAWPRRTGAFEHCSISWTRRDCTFATRKQSNSEQERQKWQDGSSRCIWQQSWPLRHSIASVRIMQRWVGQQWRNSFGSCISSRKWSDCHNSAECRGMCRALRPWWRHTIDSRMSKWTFAYDVQTAWWRRRDRQTYHIWLVSTLDRSSAETNRCSANVASTSCFSWYPDANARVDIQCWRAKIHQSSSLPSQNKQKDENNCTWDINMSVENTHTASSHLCFPPDYRWLIRSDVWEANLVYDRIATMRTKARSLPPLTHMFQNWGLVRNEPEMVDRLGLIAIRDCQTPCR